ncbi:MAG: hypothetical protein KZQ88_02360 [Candidatus Thiodiazotropha sp. (ex Dulcina madagascariensis)]|nr:hypothetical protein [Candidatus Thiodiazotropha sp. (ex Dulcina madagascariensis)]MCU7928188.1 hypothetical protein [Candidatus Thiodiazotropha sp. (ex Dulcina madagascariensis)]
MITDFIGFLQDSANAWMLYAVSAFLIFDGIVLHFVRQKIVVKASGRGVAVGGDSHGIIVAGKVAGDVTQLRQATASTSDNPSAHAPENATTIDRTLSLAANLSAIAGLILAALTFYLTFY